MAKLIGPPQRHTNPLVWCLAIICTIIAIAVIIAGIVVFVGYLIIGPKIPFISVTSAHLDQFLFDQAGLLSTRITIVIHAENDNRKAHASFSSVDCALSFQNLQIAYLRSGAFDVGKNSSVDFNYIVESSSIPLGPEQMDMVTESIRTNKISFDLNGSSRTRWRIWVLGSAKFVCHLQCKLHFNVANRTTTPLHCTSRAK